MLAGYALMQNMEIYAQVASQSLGEVTMHDFDLLRASAGENNLNRYLDQGRFVMYGDDPY
jgi:hypothetical protein